MWRFLLAACLLAAMASASGTTPAVVFACSADETFDPVAESDVIVGGRIAGYEELPVGFDRPPFVPIRLHLDSAVVWKGTIAPDALIVDAASLYPLRDAADQPTTNRRWVGSGGACGAFDEDPTGAYVVLGLMRQPDGTLRTNRLTTFYIGRAPYDASGVADLNARLGLPVVGGAAPPRDGHRLALYSLGMGLAFVVLGSALRWQRPPAK